MVHIYLLNILVELDGAHQIKLYRKVNEVYHNKSSVPEHSIQVALDGPRPHGRARAAQHQRHAQPDQAARRVRRQERQQEKHIGHLEKYMIDRPPLGAVVEVHVPHGRPLVHCHIHQVTRLSRQLGRLHEPHLAYRPLRLASDHAAVTARRRHLRRDILQPSYHTDR